MSLFRSVREIRGIPFGAHASVDAVQHVPGMGATAAQAGDRRLRVVRSAMVRERMALSDELAGKAPRFGQLNLRRIFEVDPFRCPRCGHEMRIVAFITQPRVIDRILTHLRRIATEPRRSRAPPRRWKSPRTVTSA